MLFVYCTALFGLQEELECSWHNEGIAGSCVRTAGDIGSVLWPIRMESQEGHNPGLERRGKSAKPHGIRTETVLEGGIGLALKEQSGASHRSFINIKSFARVTDSHQVK